MTVSGNPGPKPRYHDRCITAPPRPRRASRRRLRRSDTAKEIPSALAPDRHSKRRRVGAARPPLRADAEVALREAEHHHRLSLVGAAEEDEGGRDPAGAVHPQRAADEIAITDEPGEVALLAPDRRPAGAAQVDRLGAGGKALPPMIFDTGMRHADRARDDERAQLLRVAPILALCAGLGLQHHPALIVDAHHVKLRAERSGIGNGRIYTITITCTDDKGNATSATVTVSVPLSQR